MNDSPNPEQPTQPKSFRDLALTIVCQIYFDIHVNVSGALMFVLLVYGKIHPEAQDLCSFVAASAASYLFASSKRK